MIAETGYATIGFTRKVKKQKCVGLKQVVRGPVHLNIFVSLTGRTQSAHYSDEFTGEEDQIFINDRYLHSKCKLIRTFIHSLPPIYTLDSLHSAWMQNACMCHRQHQSLNFVQISTSLHYQFKTKINCVIVMTNYYCIFARRQSNMCVSYVITFSIVSSVRRCRNKKRLKTINL